MFDLKVTLKKNVPVFSTEQNATVAIQSVHSNRGKLAAKFPRSDQWPVNEVFVPSSSIILYIIYLYIYSLVKHILTQFDSCLFLCSHFTILYASVG